MGVVRQISLVVLGISAITFIALFGHVPALRSTPIGWIYRFVWSTLPKWLYYLDRRITGGHLTVAIKSVANYLLNEKHHLVVAFYLTLVTAGIYAFVVGGWQQISPTHKLFVPIVCAGPYITMFIAMKSDPGIITPENYERALEMYPYDRLNFHPGNVCRTCLLRKPARSKHCSICKHCIAKHDHHCVWINNCVGHANIRYFLLFLTSTNILLTYGCYLSFGIMNELIRQALPKGVSLSDLSWALYIQLWGIAIVVNVYVGAVFLLTLLTGILSYSFIAYHLYLIWAGTTTNESFKWSDWRGNIYNGEIMIADPDSDPEETTRNNRLPDSGRRSDFDQVDFDDEEMCRHWPRRSKQFLVRVDPARPGSDLPRGFLWRRVEALEEIDNVYDLGWRENLKRVLWPEKI
ncbi:palmitoyltransferase swf1 [Rhizina undulata]